MCFEKHIKTHIRAVAAASMTYEPVKQLLSRIRTCIYIYIYIDSNVDRQIDR